jgi:hypothetical protein
MHQNIGECDLRILFANLGEQRVDQRHVSIVLNHVLTKLYTNILVRLRERMAFAIVRFFPIPTALNTFPLCGFVFGLNTNLSLFIETMVPLIGIAPSYMR